MKIVHLRNVKKDKVGAPLFTGKVTRQSLSAVIEKSDLAIDYVHFPKGIRNKFHSHSNDQILIVTKGSGTVATKRNKFIVKVNDVVWIPANELHWHGANTDSDFMHISITKARTEINQTEK